MSLLNLHLLEEEAALNGEAVQTFGSVWGSGQQEIW